MVKTIDNITSPLPGTKIRPLYTYNDEQKALLKTLSEYAQTIRLPTSDPYYPNEQEWLQKPDTIPRYMRAAKWKIEDGKKRIKSTLEWRREFKPDLISPDEVKVEAETGKIILNGFDTDGRPIITMRPGRENTQTSPRQLRHLVYVLERAKDMMPPGQESVMILVDYKSTTLRTNPSISVASKVLVILQNHYPETLGRAIVTNLPWVLNFFYKGISPFLDPVTRDKMRFNPPLLELVPKEMLEKEFGGELEWEWDFERYWAQQVEFCGIASDGTRVKRTTTTESTPPQTSTESAQESAHQTTEVTPKAAAAAVHAPAASNQQSSSSESPDASEAKTESSSSSTTAAEPSSSKPEVDATSNKLSELAIDDQVPSVTIEAVESTPATSWLGTPALTA